MPVGIWLTQSRKGAKQPRDLLAPLCLCVRLKIGWRCRVTFMSTITRLQIQKNNKERVNVFLDDEYAFAVALDIAVELRKGQELVLTLLLELLLDKQRILEIYLNNVEWGAGVFGAQAAAEHYFRKPAARLSAYEAARLAVMLPRPKYFEKLPHSAYLSSRASTIVARMPHAQLP